MDNRIFDTVSRSLAAATTRRAGFAAALGLLLGGIGATEALNGKRHEPRPGASDRKGARDHQQSRDSAETSRRSRPMEEGPCGDSTAAANRCTTNRECCTRYCASGVCRCKPNWMKCTKADQCCSGVCNNKQCDGGAKPEDSRCAENFNCQDGLACIDGICTPSSTAKCTKQNCTGCCSGTTCRTGGAAQACGSSGQTCIVCPANTSCIDGTCVGAPTPTATPTETPTATPTAAPTETPTATPVPVWSNLTTFGSSSDFSDPRDVAISPDTLTAWIVDTNNSRISVWTRPGTSSNVWSNQTTFGSGGPGTSNFSWPSGIAVTPDTLTVYVVDTGNSKIRIWTRPSTSSTTWTNQGSFASGGSGDAEISSPIAMALSTDTLIAWVTDTYHSRISVWSRPSNSSTVWSHVVNFGESSLFSPRGIAVSPDTLTVWVASTLSNRISIWTRPDTASTTWTNQTTFGTLGANEGNLNNPMGILVSSDTLTAWVSDTGNNRISIWSRPDTSSTTWTNQSTFGSSSDFNAQRGIDLSSNTLTAWIADSGNNRISIWHLA